MNHVWTMVAVSIITCDTSMKQGRLHRGGAGGARSALKCKKIL